MKITPLCEIAYKYGTDKCPQLKHTYTPYYHKIWDKKRLNIKKVVELGIGYYKGIEKIKTKYDKGLNRYYQAGASLYTWRDFFPNAQIIGIDIRQETMFKDDRIKTFVCDAQKKEELVKLINKIGNDIDIFIDDGSHKTNDQILTCKIIMPLLKNHVTYIIEDVTWSRKVIEKINDFGYFAFAPNIEGRKSDNQLVVVKHKKTNAI